MAANTQDYNRKYYEEVTVPKRRAQGVRALRLAPCGTKTALERHIRRSESCEYCFRSTAELVGVAMNSTDPDELSALAANGRLLVRETAMKRLHLFRG